MFIEIICKSKYEKQIIYYKIYNEIPERQNITEQITAKFDINMLAQQVKEYIRYNILFKIAYQVCKC